MVEETPMVEETGVTVATSTSDELGTYLVDGEGMSLYLFEADTPGEETSACDTECTQVWPPLIVEGQPQAGEGVDASLLGTFEREDGTTQVTYNGWPLYHYAPDQQPGDTMGQGLESFGAEWYVLTPAGEKLEAGEEESSTPSYS
jgi:predicted lipoprotein with Yx(FWY)xxD motif